MRNYLCSIVLIVIVAFLAGCSTTTSRTTMYKENGKEYSIHGICEKKYNIGVKIFVNDQVVINDTTSGFTPIANFAGKYNDNKVEAECKTGDTGSLMVAYFCSIYMNGNKAADLSF